MGVLHELHLELQGDDNETYIGKIVIESGVVPTANTSASPGGEEDPMGAGSYVIAVILIYGLSIVFLIASHVMLKRRELHRDNEKQIAKFLEAAPSLKEKSAKDSYKSLKKSIIPVVALSPARDLVSRRKSFAPLIHGLFPPNYHHGNKPTDSSEDLDVKDTSPDASRASPSESSSCRMSVIVEEPDSEIERPLGAAAVSQRLKQMQAMIDEDESGSVSDTSNTDDSLQPNPVSDSEVKTTPSPPSDLSSSTSSQLKRMSAPGMNFTISSQSSARTPYTSGAVTTSRSFPPPLTQDVRSGRVAFVSSDTTGVGVPITPPVTRPASLHEYPHTCMSPTRHRAPVFSVTTPLLSRPIAPPILSPRPTQYPPPTTTPPNLALLTAAEREDLMHVTCL